MMLAAADGQVTPITDVASGRVLYTRGFSSIFAEWETTDEAKAGLGLPGVVQRAALVPHLSIDRETGEGRIRRGQGAFERFPERPGEGLVAVEGEHPGLGAGVERQRFDRSGGHPAGERVRRNIR